MSFLQSQPASCESCRSPLTSALICDHCHAFPSYSEAPNYFDIFGILVDYEVDLAALEAKYFELAAQLHPDWYVTASPEVQEQSTRATSWLNQAYQVLQSPQPRTDYLLKLHMPANSQDSKALPSGFLQEMFFLQESLDELDSEDTEQASQLRQQFEERLQQQEHIYQEQWTQFKTTTDPKAALQTIQMALNSARYLQRLLDRIP